MGKKFLIIWLLAFICLFISFLCIASPLGSLNLTLSSRTPSAGDKVKFNIILKSTQIAPVSYSKKDLISPKAKKEIPINVFIGEKPGVDGNLTHSRLWQSATLNSKGEYSFRISIHDGFIGKTLYFKAFVLLGNRILESSVEKITITPSNENAKWVVTPTTFRHVITGRKFYSSNPIEMAYQKASPGDLILVENGVYSSFSLHKTKNCSSEEPIWIKAKHSGQAKIKMKSQKTLKSNEVKRKSCSTTLVGLNLDPSFLYTLGFSTKEKSKPLVRMLECSLGGRQNDHLNQGNGGWGIYFHSKKPLLFGQGERL